MHKSSGICTVTFSLTPVGAEKQSSLQTTKPPVLFGNRQVLRVFYQYRRTASNPHCAIAGRDECLCRFLNV